MSDKKKGNPYHDPNTGRFTNKGPRRIQYANSNERDDALESQENIREKQLSMQDEQRKKLAAEEAQKDKDKKIQAIKSKMEEWKNIQNDPYSSPYLREKSFKELSKLRQKLDKLK